MFCEAYKQTRAFYARKGFEPVEVFRGLWSPSNPCVQLLKRVDGMPPIKAHRQRQRDAAEFAHAQFYAIAWTCFRGAERKLFKNLLRLDPETWNRARAWALWKAAIVAARLVETNAVEGAASSQTLDEVLRDGFG